MRAALAAIAAACAQAGCSPLPASTPPVAAGTGPSASVAHDWNGDGIADRAAIISGADAGLILEVITSGASAAKQRLVLDDDGSLMMPSVEVDGNALILRQLTGGTTAVSSTHRFVWNAALGAMRLTRLDATFYSRTYAHDGREATWDLIEGTLATQSLTLRRDGGDRAYDITDQQVATKPSPPLRLEDAPAADSILPFSGGG